MPIKGLSDQRRFRRLGKLRLGQKAVSAKSGREYPEKSDHFIADFDDEVMGTRFEKLFGAEPKSVRVVFPDEDTEKVFPQYYKCYSSAGLLCKGDGESAMQRVPGEALAMDEVDCPGPDECAFALAHGAGGRTGCRRIASLQFIIPDLDLTSVIQIDTTSRNSILNINSQLDLLRMVAGRLSFVPVDLILKPMETMEPRTGKKVNIFVLDLNFHVTMATRHLLQPITMPRGLIAPPVSDKLPDDLYPRTQIAASPEPEPEPEPAPEPDSDDYATDADITAAMDAAALPAVQRAAMLQSAEAGGWDKPTLLACIQRAAKPAPAKRGRPPKQATPEPREIASEDDMNF